MYKKDKIHKGGKFVASGSYGCVYTPNIPCTGYNRDNKYISKIIRNDKDIIYEEFGKLMDFNFNIMDPTQKYILYPLELCNIEDIDEKNDNYLKDCKIINKASFNLKDEQLKTVYLKMLNFQNKNIIAPNGGEDLLKLFNIDFEQFCNIFISISIGIYILNRNGISHSDLKLGNAVIDNDLIKLIN